MAVSKSSQQWHTFYQTAIQFRDLAPWRWLYDSDLFGVQHPETGEIGWCCIMGKAGQHFALAVYRGPEGLDSFDQLAASSDFDSPYNPEYFNAMFSQNCWMISFEDAKSTPPEQKKHLRDLGLSFRGAGQWIVAQSYDAGFDPWLVDEKDLPFLIQCLQQSMDVAYRSEGNPELLDRETYLVRIPKMQQGALVWEDRFYEEEALPEPPEIEPIVPTKAFLDKVKFLPDREGAIVISNIFVPSVVAERKDQRPWRPVLLLVIEPGSGFILAQELIAHSDLSKKLEKFLLSVFKILEGKPRQIGVHHLPMAQLLEKICEKAQIELILLSGDEPFLTEAMESISGFLQ